VDTLEHRLSIHVGLLFMQCGEVCDQYNQAMSTQHFQLLELQAQQRQLNTQETQVHLKLKDLQARVDALGYLMGLILGSQR
jgi:hypothetical protein